jgi:lipoprotein-releasing system permease protein
MSFEYFISARYLRSRKQPRFISLTNALSVLGVSVGVMALIVVIAVMAGFEADLARRILGVESHAVVARPGGTVVGYGALADSIGRQDGVSAVNPFIQTQVMLKGAGYSTGAVLRGVQPESARQVLTILDDESLAALTERVGVRPLGRPAADPGIILGKELARSLDVVVGESLHLVTFKGMLSPIGYLPAMKRFRVVGLFSSGMYEYDGSYAYVHLAQAQKLMRMPQAVSGIEIRFNDLYQADRLAERIAERLGEEFQVRDWMQMHRSLFAALKLEKAVMFVILALIVLVAAFNIASSLIMMVMEKSKDIGILKAMGARDRSIRTIFVLNGLVIGILGTVIGGSLGWGLCLLLRHYNFVKLPGDVYYITTLPVLLNPVDAIAIVVAAVVICLLSTVYPARQAAGINPVEAIRYGGA